LAQVAGTCFPVPMDKRQTGHQTVKQEGGAQLVRIGGRAYRVRTQVVVEEVDCDDAELNTEVGRGADGSFEMRLSEDDATSIDKSEQAILGTCWPAMRNALSEHLHAVSKKKPKSGRS
jgi:hypothetical protein